MPVTSGRTSPVATGTPSPPDLRGPVSTDGAGERLVLRDGTAVWLRAMILDQDVAAAGDDAAGIAADDGERHAVGHAVYARVYGPRAQMTLHVDDVFWHRGLPEALLGRLCDRAARVGISAFLMRVPASDLRLLALLRNERASRESRDGAYVDVEFATPPRSARG